MGSGRRALLCVPAGWLALCLLAASGCTSLLGKPAELSVFPSSQTLSPGEAFRLRWSLTDAYGYPVPSEAANFEFASDAPTVVRVAQDGTVEALAPGLATVTVTSISEPSLLASCTAHVTAP